MSKSNIVLNNVMLINNGRAADFLKWIQDIIKYNFIALTRIPLVVIIFH